MNTLITMSRVSLNQRTGNVRMHCHWSAIVAPVAMLILWYLALGFRAPPTAVHGIGRHKPMHVMMAREAHRLSRFKEADYPCDDSDGPDRHACQVRCGHGSCMEPYSLCLAHLECGAIVVNEEITFATLKRTMPRDPSGVMLLRTCSSREEWRAWLSVASLASVAVTESPPRPIRLALSRIVGHDFACPDSEGTDPEACQLQCHPASDPRCVVAYHRCLAHASCDVVELNAPECTWATLKATSKSAAAAEGAASGLGLTLLIETEVQWQHAFRAVQLAAHEGVGAARAMLLHPEWRDAPAAHATQAARPLALDLSPSAEAEGDDFSCVAESEGNATDSCQVACLEAGCMEGYQLCQRHVQCVAVHLNEDRTWATLKKASLRRTQAAPSHAASEATMIRTMDEWLKHACKLPHHDEARRQRRRGLLLSGFLLRGQQRGSLEAEEPKEFVDGACHAYY